MGIDYSEFLAEKVDISKHSGFEIELDEINPILKPHQKDVVKWAIFKGCAAIFASFGLGKTFMQIEIMRIISKHKGGKYLIVMPIGVRQEFKRDAVTLDVPVTFIRKDEELTGDGVYITNYESLRDGKLTPSKFTAISLDEADVLRSFGSKTYQTFLTIFDDVKYKFVATATPSPNRFKELIHYAGFLGVMDTGQSLAQPLDSKVLTPNGWELMGNLSVGDSVIARDGTETEILGVYPQGKKDIFTIYMSDGSSTQCTDDHLWLTQTQYQRNACAKYVKRNGKGRRYQEYFSVKDTSEISRTLVSSTGSINHSIPLVKSVVFPDKEVKINPYLLGCLLGDGHIRTGSVSITTVDDFIIDTIGTIVKDEYSLQLKMHGAETRKDGRKNISMSITCGNGKGSGGGRGKHSNGLLNDLKEYNLLESRSWNKTIPEDYLFNSVEVRLMILRGLMDADGTISSDSRTTSFLSTSLNLAKGVQFIVQSLGGVSTIRSRMPHKSNAKINGRIVQGKRLQYHVSINLPNNINPFLLPRKRNLVTDKTKYTPKRYIKSIEKTGEKEAQCIAIKHPDRLYVTDDFIVTHNTRFFQRDSTKANNLTLYPHKEKEFWMWIHSWAIFLQKPSDLGYSDEGYDLPKMHVHYHEVETEPETTCDRDGQFAMFPEAAMSLQQAARSKNSSLELRIAEMVGIIEDNPDDHVLLWHDLEKERHAIRKAIPEAVSVYGSQDLDLREKNTIDFGEGRIKYLSTKPILSGSGCNFQKHCHRAIFTGIGFKFKDFIQSCHRIFRFMQEEEVHIHIIYADTEKSILKVLQEKWKNHNEMVGKMSEIIKKYGLNHSEMVDELKRSIGVERIESKGVGWMAANNDCVAETTDMDTESVDLIVTSIPFSNHYEYTPSYNDFGHTEDNDHFWNQMDYLTPQLLRILKPGRVYACHVKDRILFGSVTGMGMPTVSPFHAEAMMHGMKHGFAFMGMITVVTDVVRENNQTYRLGWTENCKDGTKMGVGSPEYVLLFRKLPTDRTKAYADTKVKKNKDDYSRARWQIDASAFWRSSGDRSLTPEDMAGMNPDKLAGIFATESLKQVYDYETHVTIGEALELRGALPARFSTISPGSHDDNVWTDVNRMHTLNGSQAKKGLQAHVCPLQFDIVDRLIDRYSQKGELVFDPFGGLMTVPYRAVLKGRKGRGVELNTGYFFDGIKYLQAAENKVSIPTLFDYLDSEHDGETK